MKFLTAILGSEQERAAKKRKILELSLHRLEEKAFLLEMELEETRRQRDKVLRELRPIRHVSTVSVSSTDFSFRTDSSNIADSYCCLPIDRSAPRSKEKRAQKPQKPSQMFAEEETSLSNWSNDYKYVEKY